MSLIKVTDNNVFNMVKITEDALPVKFELEFFQQVLKNFNEKDHSIYFSKLIRDHSVGYPVGCVKAKMLYSNSSSIVPTGLYIEVIAVCESYRNKSYGTQLLEFISTVCKENFLHQIYVHVAVNNTLATEWYMKHGFVKENELLEKYYTFKNGDVVDALVLKKTI